MICFASEQEGHSILAGTAEKAMNILAKLRDTADIKMITSTD